MIDQPRPLTVALTEQMDDLPLRLQRYAAGMAFLGLQSLYR